MTRHTDPDTRHDFLYVFDVTDGNPNGDPDAANMPRMDPETSHGFVTDVSLKRKVRDFVATTQKGTGKAIFIQSQTALNDLIKKASGNADAEKGGKKRANINVKERMCEEYYDIRMFGAVLTTGEVNAGQVRGPLQLTFGKSLDPILPMDLTITRQARTTTERMETGTTEIGRKHIVPYGAYVAKGHYNPFLGKQTGVTEEDLKVFWQALEKMFEFDRSASRGEMAPRGLWVFTHDTPLGNHPSHKLFELVQVRKKPGVAVPRSYRDYEEQVEKVPSGVALTRLI